jgi:urease accessory protein
MSPQLLLWLSPAFPVGAYAYSQGLERAVEARLVHGRSDVEAWLADLFACGAARSDLIVLSAALRAQQVVDLAHINAFALALQPSAERYLETTQQGGSFLDTVSASWPHAGLDTFRSAVRGAVAYPVAVGVTAAAHAIPVSDTLSAYGHAIASNLTSAAIRLSLLGQTDAQRVLATLSPVIDQTARFAETSTLDDIASATFSADLASLEHETQYTRLFRS